MSSCGEHLGGQNLCLAIGLVNPGDWNAAQRGCLLLYPTTRLADRAEMSSSWRAQSPGCPRDKGCRVVTFIIGFFKPPCTPRPSMAAIFEWLFEQTTALAAHGPQSQRYAERPTLRQKMQAPGAASPASMRLRDPRTPTKTYPKPRTFI